MTKLFDLVAKKDRKGLIELIDPIFREAAREASARAHAKGIPVADGRKELDKRNGS